MNLKSAVKIKSGGSIESRFWHDEAYKEAHDQIKNSRKKERQNRKKGRKPHG